MVYDARISWKTRGRGCPYCSGRRVYIGNCLATVYPEVAKEWHPTRNELTPYDYVSKSGKYVWWLCRMCGEEYISDLYSKVNAVENKYHKTNCPKCSKFDGEEKCREIFEQLTNKRFFSTKNIKWLISSKTGKHFQADGYCEELNMIFEFQGNQHYSFNSKFHKNGMIDFWLQLQRDAEKTKLCKENNCTLIVLYQNQSIQEIEQTIREALISRGIPIKG
jgi:DNA-directed RNA polymerase subunit RPC12/RpoP